MFAGAGYPAFAKIGCCAIWLQACWAFVDVPISQWIPISRAAALLAAAAAGGCVPCCRRAPPAPVGLRHAVHEIDRHIYAYIDEARLEYAGWRLEINVKGWKAKER